MSQKLIMTSVCEPRNIDGIWNEIKFLFVFEKENNLFNKKKTYDFSLD